jgi:hypothetical protein
MWMTSEGSDSVLESAYPVRYLYTTVIRPEEKSTIYFEVVRRRNKVKNPGDFPWRHRLVWLQGGEQELHRLDLSNTGDEVPDAISPWVNREKAGGVKLMVKDQRRFPVKLPALDRWGAFELLRTLPLEQGAEWSLSGTASKAPLTFEILVEDSETLEAAGKTWDTWKIRIKERKHSAKREDADPLYVWISTDEARIPVRFTMDHDIGELRLTLK